MLDRCRTRVPDRAARSPMGAVAGSGTARPPRARSASRLGLLLVLVLGMAGLRLEAATVTWTGAGVDSNWSTGANWGGVAPVTGDSLVFDGSTQLTPNNDLAIDTSFASVTFAATAGAFTIGGSRIVITGTITNFSAATETLACDISGTYGVLGSSGRSS